MSSDEAGGSKRPKRDGRKQTGMDDRDVGVALRAVYQKDVSEQIPSEMLDLLNKLG